MTTTQCVVECGMTIWYVTVTVVLVTTLNGSKEGIVTFILCMFAENINSHS